MFDFVWGYMCDSLMIAGQVGGLFFFFVWVFELKDNMEFFIFLKVDFFYFLGGRFFFFDLFCMVFGLNKIFLSETQELRKVINFSFFVWVFELKK